MWTHDLVTCVIRIGTTGCFNSNTYLGVPGCSFNSGLGLGLYLTV